MAVIGLKFDATKLRTDVSKILRRKVTGIANNKPMYRDILTEFSKEIDKYVPYDKGILADSVSVTNDGLTYRRYSYSIDKETGQRKKFDVAAYQYENVLNHTKSHHPEATDHWAGPAVQAKIWPTFSKKTATIIRRHMKGTKA